MGIFSRIFRSQPQKTFSDERLGVFTLVYSRRKKYLWSNSSVLPILHVEGTEDKQHENQLDFLTSFQERINSLNHKITLKFKSEFHEAELEATFLTWQERFDIKSISVMLILENVAYWNICFEDKLEPYYHFTLYIEGNKLTDFSIDS